MAYPTTDYYGAASGQSVVGGREAALTILTGTEVTLSNKQSIATGFSTLGECDRSVDYYGLSCGHQGSVYMPRTNAVYYFGAETHNIAGQFTNAVYRLNLKNSRLFREYDDSAFPGEYRFDVNGIPWADAAHSKPWAMHSMRQIFRYSAEEFCIAYPTTDHAGWSGHYLEGTATERKVLFFYNVVTGVWRAEDGGSSNANIASFLNGNVGYATVFDSANNRLISCNSDYLRILSLDSYSYTLGATTDTGYNNYGFLRPNGDVVFCGGGYADSSRAIYTTGDPDNYSATKVSKMKSDFAALSGYVFANGAFCLLGDGSTLIAFGRKSANNELRAFAIDLDSHTAMDTGNAITITGLSDANYWMKAELIDPTTVVLSERFSSNSKVGFWSYRHG